MTRGDWSSFTTDVHTEIDDTVLISPKIRGYVKMTRGDWAAALQLMFIGTKADDTH